MAELVADGWATSGFHEAWLGLMVRQLAGSDEDAPARPCWKTGGCDCVMHPRDEEEGLTCFWRYARERLSLTPCPVPDAWTTTLDEDGGPTLWVCEVDVTHADHRKWDAAAMTIDCIGGVGFAEVRRTPAGFVIACEETRAPRPTILAHLGSSPWERRQTRDMAVDILARFTTGAAHDAGL